MALLRAAAPQCRSQALERCLMSDIFFPALVGTSFDVFAFYTSVCER
jgi:hypothetical protein